MAKHLLSKYSNGPILLEKQLRNWQTAQKGRKKITVFFLFLRLLEAATTNTKSQQSGAPIKSSRVRVSSPSLWHLFYRHREQGRRGLSASTLQAPRAQRVESIANRVGKKVCWLRERREEGGRAGLSALFTSSFYVSAKSIFSPSLRHLLYRHRERRVNLQSSNYMFSVVHVSSLLFLFGLFEAELRYISGLHHYNYWYIVHSYSEN